MKPKDESMTIKSCSKNQNLLILFENHKKQVEMYQFAERSNKHLSSNRKETVFLSLKPFSALKLKMIQNCVLKEDEQYEHRPN